MRKLSTIVFICILIGSLGQVLAAEAYTWQGVLQAGQTLYLSDNYLNASVTVLTRPVALIQVSNIPYFLANGTVIVGRMNVTVIPLNESAMFIVIRSSEPFSATFWPVVITRTIVMKQTNDTRIRQLEEDLNSTRALLRELNQTLQEKNTLIVNLTSQITALQGQVSTLKQLNAELYKNNSALLKDNARLLNMIKNLTWELNSSRALIVKLNSTVQEKDLLIENLTSQIKALTGENGRLKGQISELENKLKASNLTSLQTQLLNLTKENRKLKAELANLTNKYNQLKAKAEFLEQQNNEYRTMIQEVMNEQSSKAKQSYIEKAKKERLIGSVLLKTIIASLAVVGLVGYGLYKKKRSWELGGL